MLKTKKERYLPIEDYGIIGDLHTVALVGLDGSIDFLCLPQFDSPSVFAALLDREKGGFFQIAPIAEDGGNRRQLYLPDTNILLTRFLHQDGVAEVSDFMPIELEEEEQSCQLVRRVKAVRGRLQICMVCAPRFNYARTDHRVEEDDEGILFIAEDESLTLRLRSEVPVEIVEGAVVAEFGLQVGETAAFILEEVYPDRPSPAAEPGYVSRAFKETSNYWRDWLKKSRYNGRWQEMVNRSILVLKLLTSEKYGSIVAAPTFGLPELIGGERNWDYRYTWIRDASFTLYAFLRLGYTEEAHHFMEWIGELCADLTGPESLQPLYGIDGRSKLTEKTLPHLEGYRESPPVRIGNGAYSHLQNDIYGELMDTVYLYDKYGHPVSYDLWESLKVLLTWVIENWECADTGIWEVRGGDHEFLYSRLMCWVALDRGIRLSRKRGLPAPVEKWKRVRDDIYEDIYENFWSDEKQAFVQTKNSNVLDAACLVMPLVRFISPADPRWLSTLKAVEEELVEDSLVFRYRLDRGAKDGLEGEEGTFSLCSFWYVECLSRSGDLKKARLIFEKMLGYANHLGLYAEELGLCGEHLGNFPQAFTHIALISAAYDLNRNLSKMRIE